MIIKNRKSKIGNAIAAAVFLTAILSAFTGAYGQQATMTMKLKSERGNEEVKFSIGGNGNAKVTVNWGDGATEPEPYSQTPETTTEPVFYVYKHVYATSSERTITIKGDNITHLKCCCNQLTGLDVSKNTALTWLNCSENQLTSLDVSKNTALTLLNCYDNRLKKLDVSKNKALTVLDCSSNQLTNVDVGKNTALTVLNCGYNQQLTVLDVRTNTALKKLTCAGCRLTDLDVSKNDALIELWCSANMLTALDVGTNTALDVLSCFKNRLTFLDVSKNTALTHLFCDENQLTSLDVSKNKALKMLNCSHNRLTDLDVSYNTSLIELEYYPLTDDDVRRNREPSIPFAGTSAKPVTVELSTRVDMVLKSGDEHLFRVHIPQDGIIHFETAGNIDTYMELYYADTYDFIMSDDDSGNGNNALIEAGVDNGDNYLVKVSDSYGSEETGRPVTEETGEYQFNISFTPIETIETEKDKELEFQPDCNTHWLRFNIDRNDYYDIGTTASDRAFDTHIDLYDRHFKCLARDGDSGYGNDAFINAELDSGTYHLSVRARNFPDNRAYTVRISHGKTIKDIEAGKTVTRTLDAGDAHWYGIYAKTDGTLVFEIAETDDAQVIEMDVYYEKEQPDDDDNNIRLYFHEWGDKNQILIKAEAGTAYRVKIHGRERSDAGTYRFRAYFRNAGKVIKNDTRDVKPEVISIRFFEVIPDEPEEKAKSKIISVLGGAVTLELSKGADFPCIGVHLYDNNSGQTGTYFEIKRRGEHYIIWGKKYKTVNDGIEGYLQSLFTDFYKDKNKKHGKDVWDAFVKEGGLQQAIKFVNEIIDDEFLDSPFNETYG